MKHLIILLFLLLQFANLCAQDLDEEQLALQYYNSQEYDKALVSYTNLFENKHSDYFFRYLVNCYLKLEDYDGAEQFVKKQLKRNKSNVLYSISLGNIYKHQNNSTKADEIFQSVLDGISVKTSSNQVIDIANYFISIDEYDRAEKAIIIAKSFSYYDYDSMLIRIYRDSRNFEKLFPLLFDSLQKDQSQLESVRSLIVYCISREDKKDLAQIIEENIISRIQQNNQSEVLFTELLIWFYNNQKKFNKAFIQARALDKRFSNIEDGSRVHDVAIQALKNKDYKTAENAYDYLIKKGDKFPYYTKARFGILEIRKEQIIQNQSFNKDTLLALEKDYSIVFEDYPLTIGILPNILDFVDFEIYYNQNPDKALEILDKAYTIDRITYKEQSQIDLLRGDIYLFKDSIWDATMIYAKVQQDQKNNDVGDKATFNKARMAYFTHNFKWALSQFDVLKASTSKLIANDAMQYALFLRDNMDEDDTLNYPDLVIFANADRNYFTKKYNEAILAYDSIINIYPQKEIANYAEYNKAKILEIQKDYSNAKICYQNILNKSPYGILADKVCFYLAEILIKDPQSKEQAQELYLKVLEDFPGSVFAVKCRERLKE